MIDFDMFGYQFGLNFNKKGDNHKTMLGGLLSLFIKTAWAYYTYMLVSKLLTMGGDTIS